MAPDGGHVRVERPVGDGDEGGGAAGGGVGAVGEELIDAGGGEFGKLGDGAEHQFTVCKFVGEGASGLAAPGVDGAEAGGGFAEGGMYGLAEGGKAIHGDAECGESVAHIDGAAAGVNGGDDDFAEAAATGGAGYEFAEGGYRGHGGVGVEVVAPADEADHFVDESVKADGDRG